MVTHTHARAQTNTHKETQSFNIACANLACLRRSLPFIHNGITKTCNMWVSVVCARAHVRSMRLFRSSKQFLVAAACHSKHKIVLPHSPKSAENFELGQREEQYSFLYDANNFRR